MGLRDSFDRGIPPHLLALRNEEQRNSLAPRQHNTRVPWIMPALAYETALPQQRHESLESQRSLCWFAATQPYDVHWEIIGFGGLVGELLFGENQQPRPSFAACSFANRQLCLSCLRHAYTADRFNSRILFQRTLEIAG